MRYKVLTLVCLLFAAVRAQALIIDVSLDMTPPTPHTGGIPVDILDGSSNTVPSPFDNALLTGFVGLYTQVENPTLSTPLVTLATIPTDPCRYGSACGLSFDFIPGDPCFTDHTCTLDLLFSFGGTLTLTNQSSIPVFALQPSGPPIMPANTAPPLPIGVLGSGLTGSGPLFAFPPESTVRLGAWSVTVSDGPTAVPEPPTVALLVAGLLGLALFRKRILGIV